MADTHILPSRPTLEPRGKPQIDLHAALRSTLRSWLTARDGAVWTLSSGSDLTERIEEIKWEDARASIENMNRLRLSIFHFAGQLSDSHTTIQSVISSELDALLADESPKFLLTVPHLPGSF